MARSLRLQLGVLVLLGFAVSGRAEDGAVVSGVVRNAQGVPQMGALVEILSQSSVVRATTFTDLQGRYLIASLLPGRYQVRASAALFVPALQDNLHLQSNRRAIVNLTLSTLFDQATWLPTSTKKTAEPPDDWSWTLRSAASRPILKFNGNLSHHGPPAIAAHAEKHPYVQAVRLKAGLASSSRTFGNGGGHLNLTAEESSPSGRAVALRVSTGQPTAGSRSNVPLEVSTSLKRTLGFNGIASVKLTYQSHPEITGLHGEAGLKVVMLSSAERFEIGDSVNVEVGNRVQAISGPAAATVTRPFLRVSAHPGTTWAVTYALATSPDLQDFDAANSSTARDTLPASIMHNGRVETDKGQHQVVTLSYSRSAARFAIAYYMDSLDRVAVAGGLDGGGQRSMDALRAGVASPAFLIDRSNGSLEALVQGYRGSGLDVLLGDDFRNDVGITLQYCTGSALQPLPYPTPAPAAADLLLHATRSQAATLSLKLRVPRTATKLRASYRWQPDHLVTSIDPYEAYVTGNYLGLHLRQRLVLARILPDGLEFTIDGTNVLSQGYQHLAIGAGIPIYLASSPMSLQAGVAFSF